MDVYLYADETGNLDYGGATKQGASPYFGFGTAVFIGDHGVEASWVSFRGQTVAGAVVVG